MNAGRRLLLVGAVAAGTSAGLTASLLGTDAGAEPGPAVATWNVAWSPPAMGPTATSDAAAPDAAVPDTLDAASSLEARILLMLGDAAPRPEPVATNGSGEALAAASANLFALDVFPRVAPRGNAIFSPVGLAIALAMVRSGARSETEREMTNVLHLEGMREPDAAFGRLLAYLRGRDGADGVVVDVGDRLWTRGIRLEQDFADRMLSRYAAPVAPASVDAINAWASAETRGRIPAIVSFIPGDVRLVLTNAVYFNGKWEHAFEKRATASASFHAPGGTVSVPTMKQETWLAYAHLEGVQAVELPYRGGFSMLVMLPDAVNGLRAVESNLTYRFQTLRAALRSGSALVDMRLPRWTMRWEGDLVGPLRSAGLRTAFAHGPADFSGIAHLRNFAIDDVFQSAFIDVNEDGTEAAAVTVVEMGGDAMDEGPRRAVFHADHPFLYVIHEAATDAILFMGRVDDPSR